MTFIHILTYIKKLFKLDLWPNQNDEAYLANSVSIVDLELRIRELEARGLIK